MSKDLNWTTRAGILILVVAVVAIIGSAVVG